MQIETTIKDLSIEEADTEVEAGAIYVDLRKVDAYLDVHIPGSICLQYEFGPGMPGRARDCIPLSTPFILVGDETTPIHEATAAFRGKGFSVIGHVPDGVRAWGNAHGTPASTEASASARAPEMNLLSVGDPGSILPKEATLIPVEELWAKIDEVPGDPVCVLAGRGVRAAIAVGLLERAGREGVTFWRYRPS